MWNKSALLLIVGIKLKRRWGFTLPVPIWVVDQFMEALTDLAWAGELVLKNVPAPRDGKARNHLNWVKGISLSGIMATSHGFIKDIGRYKGLEVVDVETADVQVKISLK